MGVLTTTGRVKIKNIQEIPGSHVGDYCFLMRSALPMIPMTTIMDAIKNTIDNGPTPDFFVVGGSVVTAGCVIAGVMTTVGSDVVNGTSIL